jgi:hypothetical protein
MPLDNLGSSIPNDEENPSKGIEVNGKTNSNNQKSTSIDDVEIRETGESKKENGEASDEIVERVKSMSETERKEALQKVISDQPLEDVVDKMDGGAGNAFAVAQILADSPSVIGSRKAAQMENQGEEVNQDEYSEDPDFSRQEKRRDLERERNRRNDQDR